MKNKAFSVVDIMIVIASMGLIIALMTPAFIGHPQTNVLYRAKSTNPFEQTEEVTPIAIRQNWVQYVNNKGQTSSCEVVRFRNLYEKK